MHSRRRVSPITILLIGASALLSLALVPLSAGPDWLRRPLWDDAYYYLVVARNLSHGLGSTVNGQFVNGYQPLHLLPCLLAGRLAAWNLYLTPAVVTLWNWSLYNLAAPWLLVRLWRRVVPATESLAGEVIVVSLWLFHAYGQRAALNGMETTLALLFWLLALTALTREESRGKGIWIGIALGLAFLARNDAVVLAMAYGTLRLGTALVRRREAAALPPAVREVAQAALMTTLVAFPWLAFNALHTGSLLPQSGYAEAAGGLYDLGRETQVTAGIRAAAANMFVIPLPLSGPASAPKIILGAACTLA